MVRIHRIMTAAFGFAMFAQSAVAQSSASLTHTVSVTVPPRVKVEFGAFALSATPASGNSALKESTEGISLSVKATRAWVLSIASGATSHSQAAPIRWSRNAGSGYTTLEAADMRVASGTFSSPAASADVFIRGVETNGKASSDSAQPPIVLTIVAP